MNFLRYLLKKMFALWQRAPRGTFVARLRTVDDAIPFRMRAGFAGEVTRTHPASILPFLMNVANPLTLFGQPVVINTADNTGRFVNNTDAAAAIVGILVRPFPTQQRTGGDAGSTLGTPGVPQAGAQDMLTSGTILVQLNTGVVAPTKGGTVFIWIAATSGNHVQGGFETQANGGNTVQLDAKSYYNGPADANGLVEICFNL